nr:MFS transporter [Beijerinckia indica]
MSNSVGTFVAMRVLQGMGGAMMVPVGRLVVLNNTPKGKLIQAIATITWPALVAPILGPPIGGFLTDHASWRWIFYLNLPLGLLALVFALRLVPATTGQEKTPFDWPGFVASGIGLASLMYGFELLGHSSPGAWQIVLLIATGALFLCLAFRHFRRATHPMIALDALAQPTFTVTILGGSLFRMAIGAVPFLLPLLFQLGFGFDAFHAGLLTLAVFAGNLSMKPATTRILRRFGFKPVLVVNGLINAIMLAACTLFTPTTPVFVIVTILFIGGLCRSMQFTALNAIAFADVPTKQMSGANTLFSTALQLTMGMGIAVGAIAIRIGTMLCQDLDLLSLPAGPYRLAFLIIATPALLAIADCLFLKPDAGAHISRKTAR